MKKFLDLKVPFGDNLSTRDLKKYYPSRAYLKKFFETEVPFGITYLRVIWKSFNMSVINTIFWLGVILKNL